MTRRSKQTLIFFPFLLLATGLTGVHAASAPTMLRVVRTVATDHKEGEESTMAKARRSDEQISPLPASPYFRITVVDRETRRGIPCVCLRALNGVEYWTDSAGEVAFHEPDMMNMTAFFYVESYGYTLPEPGPMGMAGVQLETVPGERAVIELQRQQIAERIYRCTGQGIYRDSILLGLPHPPVQELDEIPVMGQDGGLMVPFNGKFMWSWGDSVGPEFPLGVFRGVGGTSEFPENGGLDPDVGVRYEYFRADNGRIRPMVDLDVNIVWPMAPRVACDDDGKAHLLMNYSRGFEEGPGGILEYNEARRQFDRIGDLPPGDTSPYLGSASLPYRGDTGEFFIFGLSWGAVRTRIDYASSIDSSTWESFTCLKPGARLSGEGGVLVLGEDGQPRLTEGSVHGAETQDSFDRDEQGRLRWGWKQNARVIPDAELAQLVEEGLLRPEERWYRPIDVNTGKDLMIHDGTVHWNPYRRRWISIRTQLFGDSPLGEVLYFEGDTPLGPWVYCQKIVTHAGGEKDSVGFYSVKQQPEFDREGGRIVYFEGAFSQAYGSRPTPIPRYDYNELMYKMDLADSRLFLPVPVYAMRDGASDLRTLQDVDDRRRIGDIAFFAPDRPRDGTVPVYRVNSPQEDVVRLSMSREEGADAPVAFYAMPWDQSDGDSSPLQSTVPLFENRNIDTGDILYTTNDRLGINETNWRTRPLCRVWPNRIEFNPFHQGSVWEPIDVGRQAMAQIQEPGDEER